MKITKILLYNFNSFEGLNELDFSDMKENKNIVLIGGKNGAGKTSLFTAIKIALYGPLAFGHVGMNPHYIAKIKDCINSKAFQKDKVESRVQITISMTVEREVKEYQITREWDYSRQKLIEKYSVKNDGEFLNDNEISYFQNYLQSIVPPDLFEFFLFDGEEVGSIFSTSAYNAYVKNAVYTLCGLDMFEIIRKYTQHYVGKAVGVDDGRLYRDYESLKESAEKMEFQKAELQERIRQEKERLDQIETELIELETAFRQAGGMTQKERNRMTKEFEEAEHVKIESAAKLKLFVEGLMPFYILKDFTGKITRQLEKEENSRLFYYVQQKLDKADIRQSVAADSHITDRDIDFLMEILLKKLKPEGIDEKSKTLHDLSREDTRRVNGMISSVEDFDSQAIVETVYRKQQASERTSQINKVLKSVMTDEDAAEYTEKENLLLKEKETLTKNLNENQKQFEEAEEHLKDFTQQRERALQKLKDNAQNKHILELSGGLAEMMSTFLQNRTTAVRKGLEELIVKKLQYIYRKNNLITHIEIDEDFGFNLYQDAEYSTQELAYLIRNLGREVFSLEVGKKGQKLLYQRYGTGNLRQLQQVLAETEQQGRVSLYKRIDINRLSKGERQIFILSLYWAVIELSGKDIPFIIDTPYARIDASHRKEISEKFFPRISNQVIILSTDEEINEEYYRIIKPYIGKEFLLVNDESQNKTSVEQHYFFEVQS